jgi:hypothetical protein
MRPQGIVIWLVFSTVAGFLSGLDMESGGLELVIISISAFPVRLWQAMYSPVLAFLSPSPFPQLTQSFYFSSLALLEDDSFVEEAGWATRPSSAPRPAAKPGSTLHDGPGF